MKSYLFAKKFSMGIIYTSIICTLIAGGTFIFSKSLTSADTATSPLPVTLTLKPSTNQALLASHTNIAVSFSVETNTDSANRVDHISLFVTKPGTTINPVNTQAGKEAVCSAANKTNNPLNFMEKKICIPDDPTCYGTINWTPSTVGLHQVFIMAMKTADSACKPENIMGWSKLEEDNLVTIQETKQSIKDGLFKVSYPSPVFAGKKFPMTIEKIGTASAVINHVSILFSDNASTPAITNKFICDQALLGRGCELCLRESVSCDGTSSTCTPGEAQIDTAGTHKVVGVAVSNTERCTAEGEHQNVLGFAENGEIQVVSMSNPGGSGGDGGGGGDKGGDGGEGTPASKPFQNVHVDNPTVISTVTDLLQKYWWFVSTFIGIIAFSGIAYAGFMYISAAGDEKKVERAKKAIIYAIIAIVIAVSAFFIVTYAINSIRSLNIISAQGLCERLGLPSCE